ncbi:unnamed protein product [Lota lota]
MWAIRRVIFIVCWSGEEEACQYKHSLSKEARGHKPKSSLQFDGTDECCFFIDSYEYPHLTPSPLAWIPFTLTPSEALSDRPRRKEQSVKTGKYPRDVTRAVSLGSGEQPGNEKAALECPSEKMALGGQLWRRMAAWP